MTIAGEKLELTDKRITMKVESDKRLQLSATMVARLRVEVLVSSVVGKSDKALRAFVNQFDRQSVYWFRAGLEAEYFDTP